MKTIITIPEDVYLELQKHLLPKPHFDEEAAFVFATYNLELTQIVLQFQDWYAIKIDDYESRSAYHFELKQEINGRIIKRAHDANTCLIEFHSHIDQELVRFSPTDWRGFSEFVPHVLWRLKGRPYVAIVVTKQGIDALVWMNSKKPDKLSMIKVGNSKIIKPTNNSIKYKNYE